MQQRLMPRDVLGPDANPRARGTRFGRAADPLHSSRCLGIAQRHLHDTFVMSRAVHEHQRAMVCSPGARQNFSAARHGFGSRPRSLTTRARADGARLACVCRHGHRMRARVGAVASMGVNVAIAPVNVCNSWCRLRTTQRNFQLHPSRKSGHLCAVAFRLVRPSFELKCWNFGQPEKLEKGETK
jgi:hypothetical protein